MNNRELPEKSALKHLPSAEGSSTSYARLAMSNDPHRERGLSPAIERRLERSRTLEDRRSRPLVPRRSRMGHSRKWFV